ncbi:RDD family protein [Microbacterium bovistercoris]|uniref:RDD family protein n=1 Tax=Microbacterium bovistercoris TaxID=2293570 RepID=A0A371NYJ9_9MICO|nr:RDD family protein [Microbacterium bovistercoris]REJ08918.1 RDD family protein [Microbacterium bovistercoris]
MSLPIDASEEILSGEAVAIDAQPIGFLLRAAGAMIDMVLGFAVYLAFVFLSIWLLELGLLDDATMRIYQVTAIVVSFLELPVTVEVAMRGRSLGKLAVGGRIVRVDGGAIGFRHSFIRGLLGVLEVYMTLGSMAIIAGALSPRSQRLGDLVAGTYSQRVRVPALVSAPPSLPPGMSEWARIADVAKLPDRLARRISQFLASAAMLSPAARARLADELVAEAAPFVSPIPPVPAETLLIAVTVLRRARETRALALADDRAERLTGRRVGV